MKEQKRAQAAIEFLATYGWAFLAILIVMGALSYFGILSSSKLLPDRCNFGAEIGCRGYAIGRNGIDLKLSNNAGDTIILDSLAVSTESSQLGCNSSVAGTSWKAGDVKDIYALCDFTNAGLVQGDKGKLNVKIAYHSAKSSAAFGKEVNGEVFAAARDIAMPLLIGNFEQGNVDGFVGYGAAPFSSTSSYGAQLGAYSLRISSCGAICTCCNYGGVSKGMPPLSVGTKYTLSYWAKSISSSTDFHISVQNGAGDENCLSNSPTLTTSWNKYSKTCVLDAVKSTMYIWGNAPSQDWVIDQMQIEQV